MVNLSIGIFMWLLSISPVADAMLRGLESDFKIPENPRGDVIILLGGGVYDKVPDLSGIGAPSEEMIARLVTAVRLQKRLNVPVIISGGAVFKGRQAEAPIVKRFLVDLGIHSGKIIIEDKSRDTIENAKYTKAICEKNGFKKPILVTSAMHMRRSVMSYEKTGIKVVPVPSSFRTWVRKYGWEDYLPGSGNATAAIKEYAGFIFYKFAY
ncbi:MAG TPA: YdcF family protein [Nitrospiraceae bacterium]|nr:YdcF family protein [Nitrospiraceae bacterium]